MTELGALLKEARETSWQRHGKEITLYIPGMICFEGDYGRYPALSITGPDCALRCKHCSGKLLEPMIKTSTPEELFERCLKLDKRSIGVLITGGCLPDGRLPWSGFIPTIERIKEKTDLHISIHTGIIDQKIAQDLVGGGVDQFLIDVIGDNQTLKEIYNVDFGIERIENSLEALAIAGAKIIPHIVVGLHYGQIRGEYEAIEMVKRYKIKTLVFVSFMPLPGTELSNCQPPEPEEIGRLIATARLKIPDATISLGCARERGNHRIDLFALDAGVNRIAIPSDEVIERAKTYGLKIFWQKTCCSVPISRGR